MDGDITEDGLPILKKASTTTDDGLPILKKKVSTPVSFGGAPQLSGGLNPFQSSQENTPYSNITTTPQMQQQLQAHNVPKPATPVPQSYWKSLSPQEQQALSKGTAQSLKNNSNDSISSTPLEQQGDYAYSQTLPGKIQNNLTYLAQKATKGGLQVVKGAAYLSNLSKNLQEGNNNADIPTDLALQQVDKATNFLPKTSEAQVEKSKTMTNLGGLAEFLPAAAAASGTGGTTLYLQGLGQGKEIIDNAEANGAKINPVVKNAFILGTGAVQGFLMGDLGHGIFKSLGTSLKDDVVKNITVDAIKASAGKDLTAQEFTNLLQTGAKDWGDKALQGGVNYLKSTKKAITDLTGLNVANFALKQGVDATNDTPVFNETGGDLVKQEGETLKAAPLFGAAGSIGDLSKLTPFSQYKNTAVESLIHDPTDENINNTKQIIAQHGAESGWSPEEIQATQAHIDKIGGVVKSIPKSMPDDKKEQAIDLILNRNDLQKQLDNVQSQKAQLDPAFNGAVNDGQILTDKIDQANDKLKDLATGSKTTYSKGLEINNEDGTFFKTSNGVKEEITPQRYDLEKLERDAKVKPNEQAQPNTEIPAQQPADEGSSPEKAVNPTDEATTDNQVEAGDIIGVHNEETPRSDKSNFEPSDAMASILKKYQEQKNTELNLDKIKEQAITNSKESGHDKPDMSDFVYAIKQVEFPETINEDEPKNTGGETSKGDIVSSKKASVKDQSDKVDVTLGDNKGGVRTKDIVEAEADAKLKGGYDIHDLVDKIKNEKHVATDTENAILAKYVGAKTNEIVEMNKRIADEGANLSEKELADLTAKRDAALNDFQDAANANDQTRSDAGRALNSGKFKLNDNYSLENMIVRERALKGDKLTPGELSQVTKKYQDLEKSNQDYEKRLKESQEEIARLKAEKVIKKTQPRQKGTVKTHEEFVADRKKIAEDFSKKLKEMRTSGKLNDAASASAQFLQAAAPYVTKMVASLAHEKITELAEVVRRIREDLDLGDVSDKDMHDLISGKYNEPVTKNDIQDRIRKLKSEAKLLSQIHDAENGLRTLSPAKKKIADEKIDGLRTRLKELDKENGIYDERNAEASKRQLQKNIDELQGKIDRGEFEKPEPKQPPEEDEATRDLRRKRDALRHDYDLDVARRELDKRGKVEKAKDFVLNVATLPRAIKATLDFSAVLRQGLIPTIAHPGEAVKALGTMFGQTFSEHKYQNWFSDIKMSPQYDLMKASGLYIAEKNNPELLAREEQFTSNLLEKIPVLGKIHQGAERAYTGYLNAIRTGVFISEAAKLQEHGYIFKNNSEAFTDLATVVNVLSGRGSIPDWLGGKQPAVLSNIFFSPRFMAARIHTLYLWGDPRLSRSAKVLAAKDIGKTLGTVGTFLTMASLAGYSVSLDPRSSDFLKLKDGDTRYDLLGGLGQYIVFLAQQITGKKVPAGTNKANDLTTGKYGKATRLTVGANFLRGKLSPLLGSTFNLMEQKDLVGQPYHVWPNVPQEFVPLPASDIYDAYKVGGIDNALKVLIPSQFGIGVSSFKNKKK